MSPLASAACLTCGCYTLKKLQNGRREYLARFSSVWNLARCWTWMEGPEGYRRLGVQPQFVDKLWPMAAA